MAEVTSIIFIDAAHLQRRNIMTATGKDEENECATHIGGTRVTMLDREAT